MPTNEEQEATRERGHRLAVEIEEGMLTARLICPGMDKGCKPADFCVECGREVDRPEGREPCDCCPKPEDGCNLKAWFDGMGPELIDGEFVADVEVEWIGPEEGPILHLVNPRQEPSR